MDACILGASGFIGGHIARAAVADGWRVRAVRRNPIRTGAIADVPVDWALADLRDEDALAEAMRGCEIVFHAAAAYPDGHRHIQRDVEHARDEMHRVLRAAKRAGVRRMVYTSTLTTLEHARVPDALALTVPELDESNLYQPGSARSAYYDAKAEMERIALTERELEVVVLLPTAVLGPGDVKPTTSVIIRDAARGLYPIHFDAIINPVDVRDVARAHLAAAGQGRAGERYAVGGANLPMADFLARVRAIARTPWPCVRVSRRFIAGVVRVADGIPFVSLPDHIRMFEYWAPVSSRKAQVELGHTSRPLDETIRDTLAWFKLLR